MDFIVFTSGCCLIAALPKENLDFWAAVSCLERAIWNAGVIKDWAGGYVVRKISIPPFGDMILVHF